MIEESVSKHDLSSTWISQSPDLINLNKPVLITDLEMELAIRNLDFEFSILEKITNTNKHYEKIIKPNSKHQDKNRYYQIRPFEHSCVILRNRQSEAEDQDKWTNMSVESEKSDSPKNSEAFKNQDEFSEYENLQDHYSKKKENEDFTEGCDAQSFTLKKGKTKSSNPIIAQKDLIKFPESMKDKLTPNPTEFSQIDEKSNEGDQLIVDYSIGQKSPIAIPLKKGSMDFPIQKSKKLKPLNLVKYKPQEETGSHSDSQSYSFLGESNYINACYIQHPFLKNLDKSYIITQLPKSNTIDDFWTMVVENNSRIIVMLCSYKELTTESTKRYYPRSKEELCTLKYKITLLWEKDSYFCKHRRFLLKTISGESSIEFSHYKIKNWLDKNNIRKEDFQGFFLALQQIFDENKCLSNEVSEPHTLVVHCKAGVGRSGVFISMYFLFEYLSFVQNLLKQHGIEVISKKNVGVSIFATVRKIRESKWGMVMSAKQYFNLYELTVYVIDALILNPVKVKNILPI